MCVYRENRAVRWRPGAGSSKDCITRTDTLKDRTSGARCGFGRKGFPPLHLPIVSRKAERLVCSSAVEVADGSKDRAARVLDRLLRRAVKKARPIRIPLEKTRMAPCRASFPLPFPTPRAGSCLVDRGAVPPLTGWLLARMKVEAGPNSPLSARSLCGEGRGRGLARAQTHAFRRGTEFSLSPAPRGRGPGGGGPRGRSSMPVGARRSCGGGPRVRSPTSVVATGIPPYPIVRYRTFTLH
jgi:hypothetical protein